MSIISHWRGASDLVDYPRVARIGAWYVAEYRIRNMAKWYGSILAFGLGSPILYLTSVGMGIGALITQQIDGVSYLTFLAPSLLASAAIQSTMDETMFPTMDGFVWGKIFHGIGNTALTGKQLANGVMIAAMLRTVFTVLTYYAVLLAFGAIEFASSWPSLFAALFSGWSFGALMHGMASYVKQDDGFFAIFGRFVVTPMFLFSGTYYPLDSLPIYLQWIGWISPVWHATDLGRYLSYGHESSVQVVLFHLIYLLALGLFGKYLAERKYTLRLAE